MVSFMCNLVHYVELQEILQKQFIFWPLTYLGNLFFKTNFLFTNNDLILQ